MKDWLILICIGVLAFLAFHERDLWMPQSIAAAFAAPVGSAQGRNPVSPSADLSGARLLETGPGLAIAVARSQQAAVTRYPALKVPGSEINVRFNYRYKNLLAEGSPRLRDSAWPLQLADECAVDSHLRPVTAAPAPPATPGPSASRPANSALQSLRVPPSAPAAAQTLVFHPGSVGVGGSAGVSAAPADVSPARPSGALPFVTLDAVNQKSSNGYRYNWFYGYDFYDISFRQSVGISINVRNMSRVPADVNLRWLFFARQTGNNERFVFGAGGKELDLTPGQSEALAADSPMLQRRETNDSWLGQRYLSGSKYEGWLVQLVERGSNRIIKQTGSTSYLEDVARKTDFSTLMDAYKDRLRAQGDAGATAFMR